MRIYISAKSLLLVLVVIDCLTVTPCSANSSSTKNLIETYTIPAKRFKQDILYNYFTEVLLISLINTAEPEVRVKLKPVKYTSTQHRQLIQVNDGDTDIIWAVTSKQREHSHFAVYFPLTGGLMGYRVSIINGVSADQFTNIESLEGLTDKLAVQGMDWPDTEILRYNGLKVEEQPYASLFKLIDRQLADYFPRSVIEINNEISSKKKLNLIIEPSFAFYYPSPMYFFVNKENHELGQRILSGLIMALKDGSLLKLFNAQPFASKALSMLLERHIINLENPNLSYQSRTALESYKLPIQK